jgi:peptide/nickel transport system ATP-binding protein
VDDLPPGCIFAPRCEFVRDSCTKERPPLVPVAPEHLSACLRWSVVPPPAEYLREATEAVRTAEAAASEAAVLVRAQDAEVHFKAPKGIIRAVDGVDLEVRVGETLGVVGESGSGKTTVARAIIGLTPATGGEITLRGKSLPRTTGKRPRSTLREIQMVFQNPDASLNPTRTVGDAIMRPLTLLAGVNREEARRRAQDLLRSVSLPVSYFDRLPHELSGGEKQRVAIARAFAAAPELILCDEPISSLDVSVQGSLMNLLMRLQVEKRTSYLFISHDLSAVQHLSDAIAVVYLGHVMEIGNAVKVLTPPFHPYTEALLSAVPLPDPDVKQKPIRLGGSVPSAMHVPSGCRFHPRCPRFLGDVCVNEEPPWREGEGDHRIYCHIPLDELARLQAETLVFGDDDAPGAAQAPDGGDDPGEGA